MNIDPRFACSLAMCGNPNSTLYIIASGDGACSHWDLICDGDVIAWTHSRTAAREAELLIAAGTLTWGTLPIKYEWTITAKGKARQELAA